MLFLGHCIQNWQQLVTTGGWDDGGDDVDTPSKSGLNSYDKHTLRVG